ncbi:MarR family winged helix-turn-helix transcriptional regulator [Longirhabdus pacifica]|uniref:MarR family winged helix-turn-helix transcriptional regulator n=1 Tax=Longirhabdus pacifica TaxID=2305227 RepID=UPI001008838D|nr:MarR family transcriptional regulator [Longirhabdus pacifica]
MNNINRSQKLGRLFFQLQRLEKNPKKYGEAGHLTPSEIHTIDAIGIEDPIQMSELATKLKVTKGAITQIFKKLETKGLVKKGPHPTDSRSFIISLTEKGKAAYLLHEQLHLRFFQSLSDQFNEQELEIFELGIEKLTKFIQDNEEV